MISSSLGLFGFDLYHSGIFVYPSGGIAARNKHSLVSSLGDVFRGYCDGSICRVGSNKRNCS